MVLSLARAHGAPSGLKCCLVRVSGSCEPVLGSWGLGHAGMLVTPQRTAWVLGSPSHSLYQGQQLSERTSLPPWAAGGGSEPRSHQDF